MTDAKILWTCLAAAAGQAIAPLQLELLDRYLDLLLKANESMNLTAVTDRAAAEMLHVADALTLLPFLPAETFDLADVGSGGGCPAIPLAIARPEARVTCIESTAKKAKFLTGIAAEMKLTNVVVLASRAEDVGRGPLRHTFDVATARAIGRLIWTAEYCLPLLKTGGRLLAMKGQKAAEELAEASRVISKLGGGPAALHPTPLPGAEGHVVVRIPKTRATDPQFPRPPSEARGKPPY